MAFSDPDNDNVRCDSQRLCPLAFRSLVRINSVIQGSLSAVLYTYSWHTQQFRMDRPLAEGGCRSAFGQGEKMNQSYLPTNPHTFSVY